MTARALLVVLSALALLAGVVPGRPANPAPRIRSLTGDLLVASPEMRDPRFARTVIYMISHDAGGAQGFVVNRPLGEILLAKLLEQMRMDGSSASGKVRLNGGGPVETPSHLRAAHQRLHERTLRRRQGRRVGDVRPRHPARRRRRQGAAPPAARAGLCRLGARPARGRDGSGRLDPRRRRREPDLRRGPRQEVGQGAGPPEDRPQSDDKGPSAGARQPLNVQKYASRRHRAPPQLDPSHRSSRVSPTRS